MTLADDAQRAQSARPTATADDPIARERRFWMGLLYAGLAGYGAIAFTLGSYVGLTWSQPNRGWIVLIVAVALGIALICYGWRHRLVNSRYRIGIFTIWNTLSFGFVIFIMALDGGIASPLAGLLITPMFYLAIGYPQRVVLASGGAGLAATAALAWWSVDTATASTLVLRFMVLIIVMLLAVIGAGIRERKDHELAQLRRRLETLAETDDLTGCLNQRAFMAALAREVARAARYEHAISLLIIDVDNFKHINDREGHLMGDAVLRQLGTLLRQTARRADIAARFGGDELTLLAPETHSDDAYALAERLQAQVQTCQPPIDITLSIGVCSVIPKADQAALLFHRADAALYAAKHRGRNRIVLWNNAEITRTNPAHAEVS